MHNTNIRGRTNGPRNIQENLQSYIKEETLAILRDGITDEMKLKRVNVDDLLYKESDAGNLHARICEGLALQGASLFGPLHINIECNRTKVK